MQTLKSLDFEYLGNAFDSFIVSREAKLPNNGDVWKTTSQAISVGLLAY